MIHSERLTSALLAGCLVIVGVGCSSADPLEELEITLTGLEFGDSTLLETVLVASVRIVNPNPDALEFEGASFKLILDDRKVGTGLAPDAFSVDGLGTTLVDVTFHINTATALFRIVDVVKDQREVTYGIRGSLFVTTSLGRKKLTVEKMGRLDLNNLEVPQSTKLSPSVS